MGRKFKQIILILCNFVQKVKFLFIFLFSTVSLSEDGVMALQNSNPCYFSTLHSL